VIELHASPTALVERTAISDRKMLLFESRLLSRSGPAMLDHQMLDRHRAARAVPLSSRQDSSTTVTPTMRGQVRAQRASRGLTHPATMDPATHLVFDDAHQLRLHGSMPNGSRLSSHARTTASRTALQPAPS
jgi:hypothetical protein